MLICIGSWDRNTWPRGSRRSSAGTEAWSLSELLGGGRHEKAKPDHWTERGRAASVSNSDITDRPRRSVLALVEGGG